MGTRSSGGVRRGVLWLVAVLAGCTPPAPPPPDLAYMGLPVAGRRMFAERLGFTPCFTTSNALRCRREKVMLFGNGPYRAAVDLAGGGASGFAYLTIWHDRDQSALYPVTEALQAQGWTVCRTGLEDRGDQEVWTRAGAPVRFSLDISYWGKRRLRILPERGQPTGKCW